MSKSSDNNLTSRVFKSGNTAIITGASSGIGKAAAKMCASKRMNVYMLDIDEPMLESSAAEIRSSTGSTSVHTIVVDVSNREELDKAASQIEGEGVHFLMNNAAIHGCASALSFDDVATFEKTIAVNTYGPIYGCLAFLPRMLSQNSSALVVNTGSKQGITMPPGNLCYNVSKAALKTYTEGLEHELREGRREGKHQVHSALLVPGWVNTNIMYKNMRAKHEQNSDEPFDDSKVFFHENKPADGAWMPSQVVDFMLEELDQDRFYIVCPDNDVDRKTDNLRMTWTMQDITMNRPPLSRWHPEYKEKFKTFLEEHKKK